MLNKEYCKVFYKVQNQADLEGKTKIIMACMPRKKAFNW